MNKYYECKFCGQVVQGFNASQDIRCCPKQDGFHWREIDGPDAPTEADDAHAEALRIEREAERRMESEALHRLNGGWRDYPF